MKETILLSHASDHKTLAATVAELAAKIEARGEHEGWSVDEQLKILNDFTAFDFGRFLLQNRGVNGYWTHYMLTHPWFGRKTQRNNRGEIFTELEDFLLNRAPLMLATQERFEIFLRENQTQVFEKAKLASIPSGLLGELLYLDYSATKELEIFGYDYDAEALSQANLLAQKLNYPHKLQLIQQDAWQLKLENQFDLISSNGLNIYEPNPKKLVDLYRIFYRALRKGGKLVTSFLTFPPGFGVECEWDFSKIKPNDLKLQKFIFVDLISAKFQSYSSSLMMKQMLSEIGYQDIRFIYDQAKLFPTVVACKD